MAGEGRRVSLESSVVTDVSGIPSITEDEISGLSVEQLESVAEDLQALCSLLQGELDFYNRYLNSQMVQDNTSCTHPCLTTAISGSGTATPTISSLDVRGLWHGQVVTKPRRESSNRLSEREKCRLWQRELEIVQAITRKQEKQWQQELHKYQVSSLEAEARVKELQKAQQELMRLVEGYSAAGSPRTRLTFTQLNRFMEEQIRGRLRQVSHVWVQVALIRTQLSKLRSRMDKGREGQDGDPDGQRTSQVNFLKRQLEHQDAKTRVEHNSGTLTELLHLIEKERGQAKYLQEENRMETRRLEELVNQADLLQGEVLRFSHITSRINENLCLKDARTHRQLVMTCSTPHLVCLISI
ncbi:uncharacterized protein [Panulirus ornatus]|uniref:uncharacterized protein isoform X2 n=2 Tax=Panulirus ornatus TaxID=150431 RepID=UPI003A86BC54